MEKIKAFFASAAAFVANNKKWLIPVVIAVAILFAFGTGYIKGCVK